MPTPLAVPDDEVAAYFGLDHINPKDRNRLRKRGHWPPNFYVGARSFVLLTDIEKCLTERKAAADAEKARRSAQATAAVNSRWHRRAA
jgi:hypothetical protein